MKDNKQKDRYELKPDFMRWLIKDHKTKRWIATITSLQDGEKITFILNEFENSKKQL